LRDAYVFGTTEDDWQRVLAALRSRRWPLAYTEDGEPTDIPSDVREIFNRGKARAVTWQIKPSREIRVNCHFFTPDEIEFDFDPREILGQVQLDTVCEFVQMVGRAVQKAVVVCWENTPEAAIMRYEPATDELVRPASE
jgi:hypothetical protein